MNELINPAPEFPYGPYHREIEKLEIQNDVPREEIDRRLEALDFLEDIGISDEVRTIVVAHWALVNISWAKNPRDNLASDDIIPTFSKVITDIKRIAMERGKDLRVEVVVATNFLKDIKKHDDDLRSTKEPTHLSLSFRDDILDPLVKTLPEVLNYF